MTSFMLYLRHTSSHFSFFDAFPSGTIKACLSLWIVDVPPHNCVGVMNAFGQYIAFNGSIFGNLDDSIIWEQGWASKLLKHSRGMTGLPSFFYRVPIGRHLSISSDNKKTRGGSSATPPTITEAPSLVIFLFPWPVWKPPLQLPAFVNLHSNFSSTLNRKPCPDARLFSELLSFPGWAWSTAWYDATEDSMCSNFSAATFASFFHNILIQQV